MASVADLYCICSASVPSVSAMLGVLLPMLVLHDDLCLAKALKSVVGCRQPSVLTYTTKFMQERVDFLLENGMPLEAIAKAVVSHPQVCPPIQC